MAQAAAVLIFLGIIALIVGAFFKYKSARLSAAPLASTGDAARNGAGVAGAKGAISVQGNVIMQQPLIAPCSGQQCLYYEIEVIGHWKEGDSNKSKSYAKEKHAAQFALDDGSGPVPILAEKGGDFDLTKSFEETKKEGFFDDLKAIVGKGQPMMFGQYQFHNPVGSVANKFECTEKILPVSTRLFALGKTTGNAVGDPDWAQLILSSKSREELMSSTAKTASYALIGGGAAAGIGAILTVVSRMM
jgi:hypothetical protein